MDKTFCAFEDKRFGNWELLVLLKTKFAQGRKYADFQLLHLNKDGSPNFKCVNTNMAELKRGSLHLGAS